MVAGRRRVSAWRVPELTGADAIRFTGDATRVDSVGKAHCRGFFPCGTCVDLMPEERVLNPPFMGRKPPHINFYFSKPVFEYILRGEMDSAGEF